MRLLSATKHLSVIVPAIKPACSGCSYVQRSRRVYRTAIDRTFQTLMKILKYLTGLTVSGTAFAVFSSAWGATAVSTTDAFDLAAALAPSPGAAVVSGTFVEVSNANQIGTFSDGLSTVGFESGVVLSTGDVTAMGFGTAPLSFNYAGTPSSAAVVLLDQVPSMGGTLGDTAWFSLQVTPGIADDYVNFSLGYFTSEISPSDRFGMFINGEYYGIVGGAPLDQAHPWLNVAAPEFGYTQALFANGLALNPQFLTISLAVPSPGTEFTLDFVLADGFDNDTDTAVFIGEFTGSAAPLGFVAVPEPGSFLLLGISLVCLSFIRRRVARA